jgi:hypothetical protein
VPARLNRPASSRRRQRQKGLKHLSALTVDRLDEQRRLEQLACLAPLHDLTASHTYVDTPGLPLRFDYHPPNTPNGVREHEAVRASYRELADALDALLPDGRQKAAALVKVEEVMFWANAAVAGLP